MHTCAAGANITLIMKGLEWNNPLILNGIHRSCKLVSRMENSRLVYNVLLTKYVKLKKREYFSQEIIQVKMDNHGKDHLKSQQKLWNRQMLSNYSITIHQGCQTQANKQYIKADELCHLCKLTQQSNLCALCCLNVLSSFHQQQQRIHRLHHRSKSKGSQ